MSQQASAQSYYYAGLAAVVLVIIAAGWLLFRDTEQVAEPAPGYGAVPQVRISKDLAELLRDAALFRSSRRWAFLYRVLWRWQQGDRAAAGTAGFLATARHQPDQGGGEQTRLQCSTTHGGSLVIHFLNW